MGRLMYSLIMLEAHQQGDSINLMMKRGKKRMNLIYIVLCEPSVKYCHICEINKVAISLISLLHPSSKHWTTCCCQMCFEQGLLDYPKVYLKNLLQTISLLIHLAQVASGQIGWKRWIRFVQISKISHMRKRKIPPKKIFRWEDTESRKNLLNKLCFYVLAPIRMSQDKPYLLMEDL